ncbi:MAG: hypothetical protein A2V70_03995, partial [Planctomycetes bacterium RBG_13_63_9]
MSRDCLYCLLRCLLVLWFARPADGQDWTRFRGPNGAGQSGATTVPATWTSEAYRWRVGLPGIGYSSPVLWGRRVFVTSADEENATRIVCCLDVGDGKLLWKRSFESSTHPKHPFNSYAAATPTVDADRVYVAWTTPQEYTLLALDQGDGRVVWRRDLGPYVARHGSGASPILFEDTVIVANEQSEKSSAIAVDRTTGETRWKTGLPVTRGGYATPCIYQPDQGAAELILAGSAYGPISLDPRTGKKNWELKLLADRVVGSPVLASGRIILGGGEGGRGTQMVAVKPGDPGKGIDPEVAYEIKGSLPYVCTPVTHGDLLFLWFDLGVVTCLDAPTGKVHWRQRVGGNYFGSPVRVGNRIYCISRKGEMVV